ncbi:ATPase [Sodiomyces alkalinus F11]|uniref:Origin recognition complex subunit 1 n=1 Tax=Sodiomyces alkalinus (strain CBS 110278 / VKM F-3762 / F11) TaxID=1314773 RepID=A0A3N2PR88_SODAK|nr:ATPase [Sodiomyces alkalinus F11]ROT37032.1 ATPase [Sodiomyces alkalinus F11]
MRPRSLNSSMRRRRRRLGVWRDDSDDELGTLDVPWEWIYDTKDAPSSRGNKIIGAQFGRFRCFIGDCVLLKAEGSHEAWVAIICQFLEDDDGQKAAEFMWFSTEPEIRNKYRKRTDSLLNELYITPSWDVNPLAAINGKATVMSPEVFAESYPTGKAPRFSKVFVCRRGCNTRTATYTDEFVWEELYKGSEDDLSRLIDFVKSNTKSTRTRPSSRKLSPDAESAFEEDGSNIESSTPRNSSTRISTPKSKSRTITTPSSRKRILVKNPLAFTPLATRRLTQNEFSPFQLACSRLHVAAVPSSLPCREQEFSSVYSHLEAAIAEGTGSCIYIAGTPGTGKTATVREAIAQLERCVLSDELDDFIFVEINGMKIAEPQQAYSLLWEALKAERVSPVQALDLLEREFSHPTPRRIPCVVLMDELDQLVTRNQSVMYNFFNWPALPHSRLIVLAVANTMDLPERTLSNKISSRLGLTRITFPGYTHEQLMKIIESRLDGIPGNVVEPDATQFASRKVAAVSGDARRALDICRRAVELAEARFEAEMSTPSHKRRQLDSQEIRSRENGYNRVTIATIKRAIFEATSNPIQQYLRTLPLSHRVLLAALLLKMQRNGTGEATFADVVSGAERMIKPGLGPPGITIHDSMKGPTPLLIHNRPSADLAVAEDMGLQSCAIDLASAGIIVLEAQVAERPGKVRLAVGEEDIRMAFRDDADMNALGIVI